MVRRPPASDAARPAAARTAYERALGLLARREYSRHELRTRLERAGCDALEVESALDRLRAEHSQDDGRFGEMLVRTRIAQGYGPARIRVELRAHALPDATIRRLIDGAEADWQALAMGQLKKKYGARPTADYGGRAKRASFLVRRGFTAETARIVTHSAVEDPSD